MPLFFVCSECDRHEEISTAPGETLEAPEGWSVAFDDLWPLMTSALAVCQRWSPQKSLRSESPTPVHARLYPGDARQPA